MNIILCGMPMCGKSTCGQLAADALNLPFIDTDTLIEASYKEKTGIAASCRTIFQNEGALFFRALERQQIACLAPKKNHCIALGGGALSDPSNREIISALGTIIYLQASPDELWRRLKTRGIPPYLNPENPKQDFFCLAKKRAADFEAIASFIIDTSSLNLETAVRRGKVMQDFVVQGVRQDGDITKSVRTHPVESPWATKDCVNLPLPTAVSGLNEQEVVNIIAFGIYRTIKEK